MRLASIVVTVILGLLSRTCAAQTARDYYNELYKAGGLDRMSDGYVCFDDSPDLQTFFILSKSATLKDFLVANSGFAKLTKAQQAVFNKGFLIVRSYDKGVALAGRDTYSKDDDTWVSDPFTIGSQKARMRMRLSIAWETLRYKRTVEILNSKLDQESEVARYGRCEMVSPDVEQKGN
jgi:16S rRNA U516 pseudouridylate synthase RsuA-like enzyme